MDYGIQFRVWGDFALFTRPEMKAERVSYDVPPASAMRGIAEAIHWKPAISYEILSIAVLNPIRFASIRRNELGIIAPGNIEDNRQQRASLVLRDVDYIVRAAIHPTGAEDRDAKSGVNIVSKHRDIFRRRLEKGQQYFQPYLGTREFPAHCAPVPGRWNPCSCNGQCPRMAGPAPRNGGPPTMCRHNLSPRPLGSILREKRYEKARDKKGDEKPDNEYTVTPEFFVAIMKKGVVDFAANGGRK